MADIESNIHINIDTRSAQASLKTLAGQISAFQQEMAAAGGLAAQSAANMQRNLVKSINQTGKWNASLTTVKSTTESFTHALENNKLSMGEYFRYAGASTKTFGKLFKNEFSTINKVARERVKDLQSQYVKLGRTANGSLQAIKVRPLALDMENLSTKTQMAAQRQALLNQLLKQGSTQLLNWGKNTQWAGRQLMVGFTVPLMMLGSTAAKTFMEMETAVLKFQRVYGDMNTTVSDTTKMTNNIKKLASEFTKYGVAVKDTMDMAANAAAAGKMGDELMAQVAQASKLAVLGGVDQQKALETTMSLTNAFGISAEDLAKKVDFLNAAENQTVTSIEDLTIAIPKAAPVVKQLGGNVEDLTFFLTAMREGGINASEGANALKSGLASMINPTKAASQFLQGFGINLKGIVEANKGDVKGMVMGFAQALNTLDPLNRARAIEQLFGKFQFARMSTLFQNVVKEGSQAQKVLGLMRATKEELAILSEREMKKIEDSPMYKFKKAIEDTKAALVPLGAEFLKAVTPIIKFVGDLLKKFNGMDEGSKQFFTNMTMVIAGLGPVILMTVGLIANGIANVIKLFSGVKSVFNAIGNRGKDLGSQVKYMTQEQLDAAAAASSLEQSHQRLAQVYTSETDALRILIAEYKQMVALQASMRGPVMGRGPVVKAATGIITGPGTGTSDSIPAMLSNGEAVIPAKSVKKYPGMVAGLISGNIPGYKNGIGNASAGRAGKNNVTVPIPYTQNVSSKSGAIEFGQINATQSNLAYMYTPEIMSQAGVTATAISKELTAWEAANKTAIAEATAMVNAGVEPAIAYKTLVEKFNTDMESAGGAVAKFRATAQEMMPVLEADLVEAQAEAKRLGLNLRNGADTARLAEKLPTNMVAQSMNTPIGSKYTRFAKVRGAAANLFGMNMSQQGIPSHLLPAEVRAGSDTKSLAYRSMMTQEHVSTTSMQEKVRSLYANIRIKLRDGKLTYEEAKREEQKIIQEAKSSMVLGAKKRAKIASPSKEMEKVGEQISEGAIQGAKSKKKQAIQAGEELGNAVTTGASQAKTNSARVASRINSAYRSDSMLQALTIQKKQAEMMGANSAAIEKEIAARRATIASEVKLAQANEEAAIVTQERAAFSGSAPLPAGAQGPIGPNDRRKTTIGDKAAGIKNRMFNYKNPAMAGKNSSIGMGMMLASSAAMMIPGKAGETAQELMGPLMGASMALSMIPGPAGAVTAGLIAVGGTAVILNNKLNEAAKAQAEATAALGTGNEAMNKFAEFSKRVTASDIMTRRRQDSMSAFGVQPGKSTFGESFVASESGKSMLKAMGQKGTGVTAQQLKDQMMAAVLSGAMSQAEAMSTVAAIGEKTGNRALSIQVNAQLNTLLGPDGQNLKDKPLELRMAASKESLKTLTDSISTAQKESNMFTSSAFSGSKLLKAGAEGAKFGAAGGGMLIEGISQVWNFMERNRAAALSMAANAMASIQTHQQLIDSLQLEYDKRIAIARAAGELSKVQDLIAEKEKGIADLTANQGKAIQLTIDAVNNADAGSWFGLDFTNRNNISDTLNAAMEKAFQGSGMELQLGITKANIEALNNSGVEAVLKQAIADKTIGLTEMNNAITAFGSNADSIAAAVENLGGPAFNQMVQIAGMFTDKAKSQEFIMKVSTMETVDAQNLLAQLGEIQKAGGVIENGVNMLVSYYEANPAKAKDIKNDIDGLKAEPTVDITVAAKYLDNGAIDAIKSDQDYFNSLNKDNKVIYSQVVDTYYNLKETPEFKSALANWIAGPKENRAGYPANETGFIAWLGRRAVTDAEKIGLAAPKTDNKTGTGGGPTASFLDEVVKRIRDFVNWKQKLTVGWDASKKAIMSFGKTTQATFDGLMNKIAKQSVDQTLLQQMLGLSAEDYNKYKSQLIDKYGKLTKFAQQLAKVNRVTFLGEMVANNNVDIINSNNAARAIQKLTKAGLDYASAAEIASDPTKAMAIALGTTAQAAAVAKSKVTSLATAYKNLPVNEQRAKDNELYQAALDVIAKKEEEINKAYDDRIAALDQIQSLNQGIAQAQQDQMDYADALSRGDIAAAAKAAMNARKNNASRAVEDEKKALETSRDEQLKKITETVNGQIETRESLTRKIRDNEILITKELLKQKQLEYDINHSTPSNAASKDTTGGTGGTGRTGKTSGTGNTNKPTGLGGNTVTHKEGDDAGGGMVWHKDKSGKWVKQKKQETNPYALPGIPNKDRFNVRLQPGLTAGLSKLNSMNGAYFEKIASQKNLAYREASDALYNKFGNKKRTDLTSAAQRKQFDALTTAKDQAYTEWQKYYVDTAANGNNIENYANTVGAKADIAAQEQKLLIPDYVQQYIDLLKARISDKTAATAKISSAKSAWRAALTRAKINPNSSWESLDKKTEQPKFKAQHQAIIDATRNDSALQTKYNNIRAQLIRWGFTASNTSGLLGEVGWSGGKGYATGGMVLPKRFVQGGFAMGTDTVPAMLTPGEFIVSQPAVKSFGLDNLKAINNGTYGGDSMYNYSVNVNVATGADANQIADAVITKIKRIDDQRLRGNNL